MKYRIEISKQAQKFIARQPKTQQLRILSAIKKLPYEGDIKQMRGYENRFRLRIGDYRAIYSKYDNILLIDVMSIGNRGDIYK